MGPLRGCTHHDPGAEADNLAPHRAGHHVPVADGQESDGDEPERVGKVSSGINSLPVGKGELVLKPSS